MKQITKILRLLCLCLPLSGFANPIKIKPRTSAVTVYAAGAKINAIAAVNLSVGTTEVIFENITPYFFPNSLQIRLSGNANLIAAIFRTKDKKVAAENPHVKIIQDSIIWAGDEQLRLHDERSTLQKETELLEKNLHRVGQTTSSGTATLSVEELQKMLAFFRTQKTEIDNRLRALLATERKLNELLAELQITLGELRPAENNSVGEIVLKIESPTVQKIEIECVYLSNMAAWSPIYDLRAAGTDQPLQLNYRAIIRNNTGFDWKDVKLSLSSVQPFISNERPILYPQFVDFRVASVANNKYYKMQNMEQRSNLKMEDAGQMRLRSSEEERAADPAGSLGTEPNFETTTDVIAVFDLPVLMTILADGQDNAVSIEKQEIPVVYEHHSVPKVDAAVFLLAKMTDYGKYNLLPGDANIFYEDTYIGQTTINPMLAADTLLISLGRDDKISIKREKPRDFKERRRVFGSSIRENFKYEITLKNNKSTAVTVNLIDQIPISKNEGIVVKLSESSGAKYEEAVGKLEWNVEVPAGKSKKVSFEFFVEYPKNKVGIQF